MAATLGFSVSFSIEGRQREMPSAGVTLSSFSLPTAATHGLASSKRLTGLDIGTNGSAEARNER